MDAHPVILWGEVVYLAVFRAFQTCHQLSLLRFLFFLASRTLMSVDGFGDQICCISGNNPQGGNIFSHYQHNGRSDLSCDFLYHFDWAYSNFAYMVFTFADGPAKAFIAVFSGKFAEMGKTPVSGAFASSRFPAGRSFLSPSEPPTPASLFYGFAQVPFVAHPGARPRSRICSPFCLANILHSP